MEIEGKKILIVGLGKSGLSSARWCVKQGADVILGDIKKEADFGQELLNECRRMGMILELGEHRHETFINCDMIIVSPGVPLEIPQLKAARTSGIPVLGEMELAIGMMRIPIIGVTGTNGKSTVVTLLGDLIARAGLRVFVGGNIGTPLMDFINTGQKADYAVIEVSSFQLDSMKEFRPDISILLNISPDHLDRYNDYDSYVSSKLRILRDQQEGQYAILNDDDRILRTYKPDAPVHVLRYGLEPDETRNAYLEDNRIRIRVPGKTEALFDLEHFSLKGRHNIENLMAVILAGTVMGISFEAMRETIQVSKALPHRMEKAGCVGGVLFIDDSKATNVDAASRSIASFKEPVILIGGGRHKYGEYAPLVEVSKGRVKKAIFIGEAKELMGEAFNGVIPFSFSQSIEDAVLQAYFSADPGDVVLMAPACSSFDMFTDYGHRGRTFKEAVERLSNG